MFLLCLLTQPGVFFHGPGNPFRTCCWIKAIQSWIDSDISSLSCLTIWSMSLITSCWSQQELHNNGAVTDKRPKSLVLTWFLKANETANSCESIFIYKWATSFYMCDWDSFIVFLIAFIRYSVFCHATHILWSCCRCVTKMCARDNTFSYSMNRQQ